MEIEELENKLPLHIYKSLMNANFDSCKSILIKDKRVLQQVTKLKFDEIDLLLQVISRAYIEDKIRTSACIPEWNKISTGCKEIDDLLHGGIPVNGISEVYGESGVGKTQFCLQLVLTVQLPKIYGGLEKSALYICTEDPFPSKRFRQMGQSFFRQFHNVKSMNSDFEKNVFVEHIGDFEQLRLCLYVKLVKLIHTVNIGIIVIDSIAGIFRSYSEQRNYERRSEDFQTICRKLYELCEKHKIGIICTNQVSDNLETGRTDPCLGLAWSNYVTCRFCIARTFRGTRKFQVVFAPHLPNINCNFVIQENGITGCE